MNRNTPKDIQFDALVQNSVDGLLVVDGEGIIRFANPAASTLLAKSSEELTGFHFGFPQVAPGKAVEITIPGPKGTLSTVELRAAKIPWEDADCLLVSLRDVTDLKMTQEALLEERNFAQGLIETAPAIILILGLEGEIIDFNSYMEEIAGYRLDEVKGENWFSTFLTTKDREPLRDLFELIVKGKKVRGHINTIVAKDGSEINIEWYSKVLLDANENAFGVLCIGQDITVKLLAEEALQKSQARHAEAQRVARIGHWSLCPVTKTFEWTEEIYHIFGLNPQQGEPIYSDFLQFIHSEDRHLFEESARTAFEKGAPLDIEFRIQHSPENIRWIHALGTVDTESEKSCITRIFGTFQDITPFKETVEKLRISEERYKLAVDGINDGIWDRDLRSNKIYYSPRWKELLGFEDHELPNTHEQWLTRIHPDDVDRALKTLNDYLEGKTGQYRLEHRLKHKDGTYRWILARGACLRDADGKPFRIAGSHTDISARKAAEEKLRQNERLLQNITENMFDLVTLTDLDGKRLYTSPSCERVLGYTPEFLQGRQVSEFVHPEDRGFVFKKQAAIRKNNTEQRALFRYRKADGSYVWLETLGKLVHNEQQEPDGLIFSSRDVSSRVKTEQQLEKAYLDAKMRANELELLLNAAKLIAEGGDFRIVKEILEMSRKTTGAQSGYWALITPEGNQEEIYCLESGCQKSTAKHELSMADCDLQMKACKSGRAIFVNNFLETDEAGLIPADHIPLNNILFAPVMVSGKALGIIALANKPADFTDQDLHLVESFAQLAAIAQKNRLSTEERNRLETQLFQAQKMESIGRLAGGVAHDFNNLLTVIQGFSDLMHESLDHNDPLQGDVAEIRKAAKSASSLTSQLLAFSRKQIIAPKATNLNALLARSEKMLRRLIGEDVDLIFVPGKDLGLVNIDPNQIDQILVNLAVNARDAMPEGGKLTYETRNVVLEDEHAFIRQADINGDFIQIAVTDTGIGITPENMKQIFEPFFTTKPQGKGTGLGLATIYGIVKQNKGYINVYSEPGHGTTFKIYLPRFSAGIEAPENESSASDQGGHETVLLVEDQDLVRKLAKRALQKKGYTVIEAENGRDAIPLFEQAQEQIDLLLTDVVMPHMNGNELYRKLNETKPGLKVLYMSGYAEEAIAHHGVLDRNTNFIQKPFRPADLTGMIRKVLDRADTTGKKDG